MTMFMAQSMTLPPYTRIREGEVHELGRGVSNGSHRARSRPLSETSESLERVCEATSAEGTARCACGGDYWVSATSSWMAYRHPGSYPVWPLAARSTPGSSWLLQA